MKKKRTKQGKRRPKARGLVESARTGDWRPYAPSISENWTEGVLWDTDLAYPVVVAREQLKGWPEDVARMEWERLEAVMYAWALEHGERPRREDAEADPGKQPWKFAGLLVSDPIDLLQRLYKEKYPKLESKHVRHHYALAVTVLREVALSEVANNAASRNILTTLFPRPANEHGRAALKGALLIALESKKKATALMHQAVDKNKQAIEARHATLRKGRVEANNNRSIRAGTKKEQQRANALKIWKDNPTWTKDQVAAEIRASQSGIKSGGGAAGRPIYYATNSIAKNIKGVKAVALASLSKQPSK